MTEKRKPRIFLRWALLLTAVIFIAVGILREEHVEVLQKAIHICLECIGIG